MQCRYIPKLTRQSLLEYSRKRRYPAKRKTLTHRPWVYTFRWPILHSAKSLPISSWVCAYQQLIPYSSKNLSRNPEQCAHRLLYRNSSKIQYPSLGGVWCPLLSPYIPKSQFRIHG